MKERKRHDAQITFRLDAKSYEELARMADEEYRRLSDYLRLIVQRHISEARQQGGRKRAA